MTEKHIYVIRHGQTDYNLKGIAQGSNVDTSLNDTGQTQARLFFEKYRSILFDRVYTSALKRTKESVSGFVNLGIPTEAYTGLNEISWGNNDGKLISLRDNEEHKVIMARWAAGETDLKIPGGESPEDVRQRMAPVLENILSRGLEKNILICTHGRAMRIMLCHLTGLHLKEMDRFLHDNLCLYKLIHKDGKTEIVIQNDKSHYENVLA